jgi:23S rRNA pseudouridine955/2504/2580 synthase
MKKFTVNENCNLKTFTDSVYPQGSFCLSQLLKNKDIKVNGARISKDVSLSNGDEVVYYTTPKQESAPSHKIVYEDENIIVCDKFSGVTYEGLLYELSEEGAVFGVHRLDRNTQGLVMFAKTEQVMEELLAAFRDKKVHKTYIALCKNNFKVTEQSLTAYILKDDKKSLVKVFDRPTAGALTAKTDYKVVEKRGDIALVEIQLHTGRTHQIRAHMAHIGCPVLGDEKYGDENLNKKYNAKRQRLIAKRLNFSLDGKLEYLNSKTFESEFEL